MVTSIFSFSHNVFYPITDRNLTFNLSSANALNLVQSKKLIFDKCLSLYHTMTTFNDLRKNLFGNIVGIGENADNKHFPCFHRQKFFILATFDLLSANFLNLVQSKKLIFDTGLRWPLSLSQTTNFRLFQTERLCR